MYVARSRTARISVALLSLAALIALVTLEPGTTKAQTPAPQTVVPGTAAIWTDKSQYFVGDPILICYRVPNPGFITITDIAADGTTRVLYSGPSDGTDGCIPGTVTPPTGNECVRMTYPAAAGTGTTQTCFQVIGSVPPIPPDNATISTDRTVYQSGDPIQICYRVPGPGPITVVVKHPNGSSDTIAAGYDDGTGACIPGVVGDAAGTECAVLTYTYPGGSQSVTQTCYEVIAAPENWIQAGSALIADDGHWIYSREIALDPTLTYVRVTSGSCADSPGVAAVWESNLQRYPNPPNDLEVWAGYLLPVGRSANSGTSGFAATARSLTPSEAPPTQVSLAIFDIGSQYQGVELYVCFRSV